MRGVKKLGLVVVRVDSTCLGINMKEMISYWHVRKIIVSMWKAIEKKEISRKTITGLHIERYW